MDSSNWETLKANFNDHYSRCFLQTLPQLSKQNIFVEQNGFAANSTSSVPLLSTLTQRLSSVDDTTKYFVVRGPSGIGKTTLALQLTLNLWGNSKIIGVSAEQYYIPLYVYITSTTTVPELGEILNQYSQFEKLILILDGYDQRLTEIQTFVESNINLGRQNIKFVLFCRDVPAVFFANLITQFKTQFTSFQLLKLTAEQVISYAEKFDRLNMTTGEILNGPEFQKKSSKISAKKWFEDLLKFVPALNELTSIPLFLSIVFQISPRILKNFKGTGQLDISDFCLTKAEILDNFVDYWFDFQIERQLRNCSKCHLDVDLQSIYSHKGIIKQYVHAYTQNLAETLINLDTGILYDDPIPESKTLCPELLEPYCNPDLLRHFETAKIFTQYKFYGIVAKPLQKFIKFLRDCSLLLPDSNGKSYRFLHRSFAEYFVSNQLLRQLKSRFEFSMGQTEKKCLLDTCSPKSLEMAFLQLLADRTIGNQEFTKNLFAIIESSREHSIFTNLAANSITILNLAKTSFANRDFRDVQIPNAILIGAKLANANFTKANLGNVDFSQAWLLGANFEGSNLHGATFGQIDVHTQLDNTSLAVWIDRSQPGGVMANILVGCTDGRIYFYRQKENELKFEHCSEPISHSKRRKGFTNIQVSGNILVSSLARFCDIKIWDLVTRKLLCKISEKDQLSQALANMRTKNRMGEYSIIPQLKSATTLIDFTVDNATKFLIVFTLLFRPKIVWLYSIKEISHNGKPKLLTSFSVNDPLAKVVLNDQGTLFAISTINYLELRDIAQPLQVLKVISEGTRHEYSLPRFSPNGSLLAWVHNTNCEIWNLSQTDSCSEGNTLCIPLGKRESVVDAQFDCDSQSFIVCTEDGVLRSSSLGCFIKIYSLPTGRLNQVINPSVAVRYIQPFSNGFIASISQDLRAAHGKMSPKLLQIWSIFDGVREVVEFCDVVNSFPCSHVAISIERNWIATAHHKTNTEVKGQTIHVYLWSFSTGAFISMINLDDIGNIVCLGLLCDGNILIVGDRGEISDGKNIPHENLKILSVMNQESVADESCQNQKKDESSQNRNRDESCQFQSKVESWQNHSKFESCQNQNKDESCRSKVELGQLKLKVAFSGTVAVRNQEANSDYTQHEDDLNYSFSVLYFAELSPNGTKLAVPTFYDTNVHLYDVSEICLDPIIYSLSMPSTEDDPEYKDVGYISFDNQMIHLWAAGFKKLVCWNLHTQAVVFWVGTYSSNIENLFAGAYLVCGELAVYTCLPEKIKVFHKSGDTIKCVSMVTVSNAPQGNMGIAKLAFSVRFKMLFAALAVENEILVWTENPSTALLDPALLNPPLKLWCKIWTMQIVSNLDTGHIFLVITDLNGALSMVQIDPVSMTWTLTWSNAPCLRLFVQNLMVNEIVSASTAVVELLGQHGAQGNPASTRQVYIRSSAVEVGLPGTAFTGVEFSMFFKFNSLKRRVERLVISKHLWTVSAVSTHTQPLNPIEHVSLIIEGIKFHRRFIVRAELVAEMDTKRVAIRVRPFQTRQDLTKFIKLVTKCRSWTISNENGQRLVNRIRQNQLTPMTYNLRTNNCVEWALETITECGVHVNYCKTFVIAKNIFKNSYININT